MEKTYLTGWVCPKCGAVMSPTSTYCVFCTPVFTPAISYNISNNLQEGVCTDRKDYTKYQLEKELKEKELRDTSMRNFAKQTGEK